ncbi:hypothetical protein BACSP_03584 [Bacillus sp. T2.9-1]|nr:hypothetical protein [Bacillus sp. T2.9-1]CAI9393570.1 hypothetical protein BACSP_03584 [Bacillus sp. T2.9-1]
MGPNHHLSFNCKEAEIYVIDGGHHAYIENQELFKNAVLSFVKR